jgi:hypothetical protein
MAVTNPSELAEGLVARAVALAGDGSDEQAAIGELLRQADNDREALEEARDLLLRRLHRRAADDFVRGRGVRLLERAVHRSPLPEPKWRKRRSRWGGLWRTSS